jgi:hypothetical protein
MKKTLITAAEVVDLAFGGHNNLHAEEVAEATIVAAQRKYLLPVFGEALLAEFLAGDHATFVEEYVKLALALYVKRLMLPALAARVGTAGVVKYIGEGYTYADSETLHRLMRRTKADADVIIDAAVDYVELNSSDFPSYSPSNNIRRSVNIDAGIVL